MLRRAWGNLLSLTDGTGAPITSTTHIGYINPIRYRGYYYDVETGLYYLQSRYYDAKICRFINPDAVISGVGVPIYGVPVSAGGDLEIIPDNDKDTSYFGGTVNAGIGTPGMELHATWSKTDTLDVSKFNVFEVAKKVYISIMEW